MQVTTPPVTETQIRTRLDGEGRLCHELPCAGCGYLLKGLRPRDTCPECGHAIEDSLTTDRLCFTSPAHLRRLQWACITMSSATGAIGLGFLAPMLVGPAGVLLIFSGALAFLIGLGMVSTEWMDRTISCGHNALMAAWSGVILFLPIVLLTFVAAADGAFAALLVSVPLCIGCVTLAAVSTLQWTHRIGSLLLSESIVKWAGALQTSALTVAGLVVLTLLIGFYSLDRYYIHPPPSLQLLTTATEIATILGLSLFFAGTAMHLARLALVFRQIKGRCGGLTER